MKATALPTSSGASSMKSRQKRTRSPAIGAGVHEHAAEDDGAQLVEAEVEGGDDAEVPAAPPEAPEQVGVLRLGGDHLTTVGGDHLGLDQVVAHEPELAIEPAAPAPQREPGDAGGGHPPTGHSEPVLLGGGVELPPGKTGLGPHPLGGRVDLDALHGAE